MGVALAVDIGGTKLAAAIVDSGGVLVPGSERSVATPAGTDAERLFAVVAELADDVVAGSDADTVVCGVGCGGPMGPGGEQVSPLNIPAWREFPLRSRLAAHLGLPVHVDNDAKALALAEGWVGAARSSSSFVAMVVSTGVGGGVVLNRRLLQGDHGNAGHIGHVIVEPDGRPCACGARGCLEAEASGTAIRAATGGPPAEATMAVPRSHGPARRARGSRRWRTCSTSASRW